MRRRKNDAEVAKLGARQYGHHTSLAATAHRAGDPYTAKPYKLHPNVVEKAATLKQVMTVLADALEAALRTVNDAEPEPSSSAPRAQAAAFTPAAAASAPVARTPSKAMGALAIRTPKAIPSVGDGTVNTAMTMLRGMDDATMKATGCPFIATPKGCLKAATCPFKH